MVRWCMSKFGECSMNKVLGVCGTLILLGIMSLFTLYWAAYVQCGETAGKVEKIEAIQESQNGEILRRLERIERAIDGSHRG